MQEVEAKRKKNGAPRMNLAISGLPLSLNKCSLPSENRVIFKSQLLKVLVFCFVCFF